MLALIARFVTDVEHLDVSDRDFLEEQVQSIGRYVDEYPEEQRQMRAMEWIEDHAEHYRVTWQRRVISDRVTRRRCADCPLIDQGATATCEIHARWSRLLEEYLGDQISSREYVEDTLSLLNEHKSRLKVSLRQKPDAGRRSTHR